MSMILTRQTQQRYVPRYRVPRRLLLSFMFDVLRQSERSFCDDARLAVRGILPPFQVYGADNIPPEAAFLVTPNHYSRPGFGAWWIALAVSAAISKRRTPHAKREIYWVMTAAWRYPAGTLRRKIITPVTAWAFARAARVYRFITMPPMPPEPQETRARAVAVLRTIRLAKRLAREGGILGIAPEGRDTNGLLGPPPAGAGEFIALLVECGLSVLPVGVYEAQGKLVLKFGEVYLPHIPVEKGERDRVVGEQVMDAIARQLPLKAA